MKFFNIIENYKTKVEYNYSIFSDLHIGSTECSKESIVRDLQRAKDKNSKIILNGDTMDMILMQDIKRAAANRIKPEDGQVNKFIKEAEEILMPYVSQLCIIALGNHETAMIKHHGVDVLAWLIDSLNRYKKNGQIQQGHFQNMIRINFVRPDTKKSVCHYDIFMHHGSGANAPVTKGMLDFSRIVIANQADLYLIGHKHNHLETTYPLTYITPSGVLATKNRRAVQTPSYTAPVSLDKNHNWTDQFYGRQALPGYAELVLRPYRDGNSYRVSSDIHIVSNNLDRSMVHTSIEQAIKIKQR